MADIAIREAERADLGGLLKLYGQLHDSKVAVSDERLNEIFDKIMSDENHHIIVATEDGQIISSCVCVIVPNLTHDQRPYAFIENVITDSAHRNRGCATRCLDYAKETAIKKNCYKIMLMTGSKQSSTLSFYRKAGYNSEDKTAFIQWL